MTQPNNDPVQEVASALAELQKVNDRYRSAQSVVAFEEFRQARSDHEKIIVDRAPALLALIKGKKKMSEQEALDLLRINKLYVPAGHGTPAHFYYHSKQGSYDSDESRRSTAYWSSHESRMWLRGNFTLQQLEAAVFLLRGD